MNGPISVNEPVAGFYRMKLRSGGVYTCIRIWYGPPHDPVTGEELDRSWRWQAEANGEPIDFDRCWPQCAADPISEEEYTFMLRRAAWAKKHAPDSAYADGRKRHDPLTSPLEF